MIVDTHTTVSYDDVTILRSFGEPRSRRRMFPVTRSRLYCLKTRQPKQPCKLPTLRTLFIQSAYRCAHPFLSFPFLTFLFPILRYRCVSRTASTTQCETPLGQGAGSLWTRTQNRPPESVTYTGLTCPPLSNARNISTDGNGSTTSRACQTSLARAA